jgi:uncharacterized protein YjbJ (UPF0337 family)
MRKAMWQDATFLGRSYGQVSTKFHGRLLAGRRVGDCVHRCVARLMLPPSMGPVQPDKRSLPMNWTQIEGKWEKLKSDAKVQWSKLTEEDLKDIGGRLDRLTHTVMDRYGVKKEQAQKEIEDWTNRLRAKLGSFGSSQGEHPEATGEADMPGDGSGRGGEPPH